MSVAQSNETAATMNVTQSGNVPQARPWQEWCRDTENGALDVQCRLCWISILCVLLMAAHLSATQLDTNSVCVPNMRLLCAHSDQRRLLHRRNGRTYLADGGSTETRCSTYAKFRNKHIKEYKLKWGTLEHSCDIETSYSKCFGIRLTSTNAAGLHRIADQVWNDL